MDPEGSLLHSQVPASHLPLPSSHINPVHASPPDFLKTHFNIILPRTHRSPKFPHSSGFPTKTLYTPLLSPICTTCPAHLILLDLLTRTIFVEQYRSLSSSLCSFLYSSATSSLLGPKYSPQHPLLKHPQPTFLPQCEGPSFTPIQNNRQNYSSIYLNFYIFGQQTGRQNILHRMIARFLSP